MTLNPELFTLLLLRSSCIGVQWFTFRFSLVSMPRAVHTVCACVRSKTVRFGCTHGVKFCIRERRGRTSENRYHLEGAWSGDAKKNCWQDEPGNIIRRWPEQKSHIKAAITIWLVGVLVACVSVRMWWWEYPPGFDLCHSPTIGLTGASQASSVS